MQTARFWRRRGFALIELPAVIAWYSEGHSAPLAMTLTDIFGHELKANMLGEEPVMIRFDNRQDPGKVLGLVVAAMVSKRPNADPPSAGR